MIDNSSCICPKRFFVKIKINRGTWFFLTFNTSSSKKKMHLVIQEEN